MNQKRCKGPGGKPSKNYRKPSGGGRDSIGGEMT